MEAAHHSMASGSLSAKSYIKDGLICLYDGIENDGFGTHNVSTLTWKNLGSLGSSFDATRGNGSWQSNGAIFVRQNNNAFMIPNHLMNNHMQGEWTYEIVFTPNSGWFQGFSGLFGDHGHGFGIVGGQDNGDGTGISFNLYYPAVNLWVPSRSVFTADHITSVSQACSSTSGNGITYKDANVVSSVSNINATLNVQSNQPYALIGSAYVEGVPNNMYTASGRTFSGVIHCLRIYNRPLSSGDVSKNHAIDVERYYNAA